MLSRTKLKILETCRTPCSFTQIVRAAGISKRNVATHINQLEDAGLIVKGDDGKYRLTDKGLLRLEREINERIESMELEVSAWIDSSKDIYEEVEKKLHLHGSALDLRPARGFIDILLGITWKDLIESFLTLNREDKEYLRFLSRLYVKSVKKFLGSTPDKMSFMEIRTAWRIARDMVDRREGLEFDFKSAWNKLYSDLSEELKEKMKKNNLTPERIFKKLKIFSYSILERIHMIRKGIL